MSGKINRIEERKCPICGKTYVSIYMKEWAYRRGNYTFCSYSCMSNYLNNKRYWNNKFKEGKNNAKDRED